MILLINTFLTTPMNPYARGHMHRDDNYHIFKYTISSLAAVNRWTRAIFNVRLDHYYNHHWDDLQRHIYEEFLPVCPRIEVNQGRCEYQHQWKELVERLEEDADPYIWYACNHDHVFMDYQYDALDKSLIALDNELDPRKAIYYSHWPEFNRVMQNNFPEAFRILPCGTAAGLSREMDSIQIVSKPLLRDWWFSRDFGNMYRPRSDWQDIHTCEPYPTYCPNREVVKHYDGYSHLFDIRTVPPLSIPPGFFERNIKVRYGYDDNLPGWVNMNPLRPYKTETPDGVDYRCLYIDIPRFWDGRISKIDIGDKYKHEELKVARNQAVRDYMCAHTGHPHLGDKMPPEEYIQRSMR